MLISQILSAIQRWRDVRRTVAELDGLSDRELQDLGISRGDITTIARNAVAQR